MLKKQIYYLKTDLNPSLGKINAFLGVTPEKGSVRHGGCKSSVVPPCGLSTTISNAI
jgi:hypothetical protein